MGGLAVDHMDINSIAPSESRRKQTGENFRNFVYIYKISASFC